MEQFFQTWFNTSVQGVAFLIPVRNRHKELCDFRYRLVNPAFARLLEQTTESLTEQFVNQVPCPVLPELFARMVTVTQTGEPQQLIREYTLQGQSVWYDISLARLDDRLMISLTDVSAQQQSAAALQHRLAMESILSTISSRFITVQADTVDACMTEALGLIGTHIGAERASVFLFSDDFQQGSCLYEWCAPHIAPRKERVNIRPASCFDWTRPQLENGQIIRLRADELPEEAVAERAFFSFLSVKSILAVPFLQDQRVRGFVGFYTITTQPSWEQHDLSLLKTFATQVANVRQRLQHESALRRTYQRLEGLHDIDQALLGYRLNDQSPLLIAMKYLHFMVPCERISVFQLHDDTRQVTARCRIVDGDLILNPDTDIPPGTFYEQFLAIRQTIHIPDLQPDSDELPPALNVYERGFRSLLIIPLYCRNKCIGAFTLTSTKPGFFNEEYRTIAQELASPVALVLYQQQLDDQLRHHTEQLEQRVQERTQEIRQLSTLHEAILKHAGHAIISTDVNGVILTANQATTHLLGYEPGELVGLVARIVPGPPDNPVPHIAHYPPDSVFPTSDIFNDAFASQGYYYGECVVVGKNGRQVPILATISTLQDEAGTLIGFVSISTDISVQKAVEAELKRTNQAVKAIFDESIDLHCTTDLVGNLLTINRSWALTLGFSASEPGAVPFWASVDPSEQETVRQAFLSVVDGQPLRNQINQFRKKDGTFCVLEWNAVKIDHLICASARDITERQQNESQLRSLNQRLQLATEAAEQGIWEIDMVENRMFWDDRVWEIYGLSPHSESLNFQTFLNLIHPEDLPAFMERYHRDMHGNTFQNITRVIRPDGVIRWVRSIGKLIRDHQGTVVRQIGVLWDVTEQEEAEQALLESEQRFREIAENVDEVYWIHSASPFQLLYLNPAYERVWGTHSNRSLRRPFSFLNPVLNEDKPAVLAFMKQYRAGQEGELYFRLQETAGAIRWIHVRTFIIRDAAGAAIRHIGIANDVTSQKEKERVLQQALQQEQALNELKSQFVSTASHEFRTPLATIQSSVDLIKLYMELPLDNARASVQRHLSVIEKEIDQFNTLLSDILTIGAIESGKVSFKPRWVDVVAICKEIIATHFNARPDQRSVQLVVAASPRPVYLDAKLISHVVVNLLSNAFKFSTSHPQLHLGFTDTTLVIQIIDEGIGIPAAEQATVFQAFFRASNTAGIPGTGLGLVISRQFVELHDGQLTLSSEEHKGTTCTITLPIACAETIHSSIRQPFSGTSLN
ncbi:PAS domain S-box protein [Spirosoma sordidisoli]|uniref:histidine kinase n=1 Tax=Spirosoma sordidisoli TaxID=2502893 RepID=A0A4Q2ULD4_9BACT|nr:PAS domain S-box protein [Spirosoma sordidisoli]RYC70134.1 PAS domain S-box protein [Spirosoma sordidisoli]